MASTRPLLPYSAVLLALNAACSQGTSGLVLGERAENVDEAQPPTTSLIPACSPEVSFENLDTNPEAEHLSLINSDPKSFVHRAAHDACRQLYRNAESVPLLPSVSLLLAPSEEVGSVEGNTIRLSTTYLAQVDGAGSDSGAEALGIVVFLLSHLYQDNPEGTPSWVVSGIADYVRISAGHLQGASASPGGAVTDGFRTTGFFFAWLTEEDESFVRDLNAGLASPTFTDLEAFVFARTNTSLADLWDEFQQTLK